MLPALVMVASSLSVAAPRSQEPAAPAAPPKVDVEIVCEAWGEPRPRAVGATAFYLQGHALRWHVGPKRFSASDALRAELVRIRSDSTKKVSAVLLQPGKSVCVGDVVRTIDWLRAAGFRDVGVDGLAPDFELRRVAAVPGAAPRFIPPASTTTADAKATAWSPQLTIDQNGRLEVAGEMVYDPGAKPSWADAARVVLDKLLQEARGRGAVRFDRASEPPREVVDEPLLLLADTWTEWCWVAKVLEPGSAVAVAFPRVRLGVTDQDLEAEPVLRAKRP